MLLTLGSSARRHTSCRHRTSYHLHTSCRRRTSCRHCFDSCTACLHNPQNRAWRLTCPQRGQPRLPTSIRQTQSSSYSSERSSLEYLSIGFARTKPSYLIRWSRRMPRRNCHRSLVRWFGIPHPFHQNPRFLGLGRVILGKRTTVGKPDGSTWY